jgi:hypothetical protein
MLPEAAQHDCTRFIQKCHLGEIYDETTICPGYPTGALLFQPRRALTRERSLHPQDRAIRLGLIGS